MSGGRLIPVLDAGSSSRNFAPLEIDAALKAATRGEIENLDLTPHLDARVSKDAKLTAKRLPTGAPEEFAEVLDRREDSLFAVGRPVSHGGARHIAPERLMAESLTALEAPTPLDPLHLPRTLMPMRAVLAAWLALPRADVRIIAADEKATTARHTEVLARGPAQ
jgi:acetate kinase